MLIHQIGKDNLSSKDKDILSYIVDSVLEPIYGDRTGLLLNEWISGEGFKFSFLAKSEQGEYQGFVSLKIDPAKPYIKISTFFVMSEWRDHGIGKELLDFIIEYVSDLELEQAKLVKVTVSEEKAEALIFFLKHGFCVQDKLYGKYKPDTTEFVLYRVL